MSHPTVGSELRAAARGGGRLPLLWLGVLFLAPLSFAFWLYYGSSWRPLLRTNHGELIDPARPLPRVSLPLVGGTGGASATLLAGKWSLVVLGAGPAGCDATCQENLVYARQTWLSLGKFVPRAQRVLVGGAGCCDVAYLQREHAGLLTVAGASPEGALVLQAFPLPSAHFIYIVDPLGNLMMRYDARSDPKGLREDLKKLLDLSHIG